MEKLPTEALQMIAIQLDSADLNSLCRVSKRLNAISTPYLYKSVTLSATELSLDSLKSKIDNIPFAHIKHTKEIFLKAPFHHRLANRCLHHDIPSCSDRAVQLRLDADDNHDEEEDDDLGPFFDFGLGFEDLLDRIPENSLRSFGWNLGTCLPEDLMWGEMSWLKEQTGITSLSLITDCSCGTNIMTQYFADLTQFTELQSLAWRGLSRFDDCQSVARFISTNGKQLKSLILDLIDWPTTECIWALGLIHSTTQPTVVPKNFLASDLLRIEQGAKKKTLPSLEYLSLSAFSFHSFEVELTHALNMYKLHTLKLRNCPHSLGLLVALLDSDHSTELRSFELLLDPVSQWMQGQYMGDCDQAVARFLKSFEGLENIYLSLPNSPNWDAIADGILNHQSTLQRLVTSERNLNDDGDGVDGDGPLDEKYNRVYSSSTLMAVGTCTSVSALEYEWRNTSTRPTCRLLHFSASGPDLMVDDEGRRSSSSDSTNGELRNGISEGGGGIANGPQEDSLVQDFFSFAKWAFSSEGLPNLQVLAWGDFSYEGRFARFNLLLCKEHGGYRTLTEADTLYWKMVDENMEMLAACPVDSLMYGA